MKRNEFEHTLDVLLESSSGSVEELLAYYQVLAEYDNPTGDVLNLVRLLSEVVSAKDENKEG